jgi:hypothetical protein
LAMRSFTCVYKVIEETTLKYADWKQKFCC